MLKAKKKKFFKNSLLLSLTELGVDKFIKSNKKFDKIINIDGKEHYGISLKEYSFLTLQKLIELNYIDIIEIPIVNFSTTRFEIMDISKLLLYNVFYRKFDFDISNIFINSTMADRWNNIPGKSFKIAYGVDISDLVLKKNWNSELTILNIKEDIINPIKKYIAENENIDLRMKNILVLSAEKYVNNIKNIYFFCLSMSERLGLYETYIDVVVNLIIRYLSYAEVSDTFSQILLEIISLRNNLELGSMIDSHINSEHFLNKEALKKMEDIQKKNRNIDFLSDLYILWKIEEYSVISGERHFKFTIEIYSSSLDLNENSNLLNKLLKSPFIKDYNSIDQFKEEVISTLPEDEKVANYLVFMYIFCKSRGLKFHPVIHRAINIDRSVIKIKIEI